MLGQGVVENPHRPRPDPARRRGDGGRRWPRPRTGGTAVVPPATAVRTWSTRATAWREVVGVGAHADETHHPGPGRLVHGLHDVEAAGPVGVLEMAVGIDPAPVARRRRRRASSVVIPCAGGNSGAPLLHRETAGIAAPRGRRPAPDSRPARRRVPDAARSRYWCRAWPARREGPRSATPPARCRERRPPPDRVRLSTARSSPGRRSSPGSDARSPPGPHAVGPAPMPAVVSLHDLGRQGGQRTGRHRAPVRRPPHFEPTTVETRAIRLPRLLARSAL